MYHLGMAETKFFYTIEIRKMVSWDTWELNIHFTVKISHKKLSAHGKSPIQNVRKESMQWMYNRR